MPDINGSQKHIMPEKPAAGGGECGWGHFSLTAGGAEIEPLAFSYIGNGPAELFGSALLCLAGKSEFCVTFDTEGSFFRLAAESPDSPIEVLRGGECGIISDTDMVSFAVNCAECVLAAPGIWDTEDWNPADGSITALAADVISAAERYAADRKGRH